MQPSKKVCVVGAGKWGKNHIRALSDLGALGGVVESNYEVEINDIGMILFPYWRCELTDVNTKKTEILEIDAVLGKPLNIISNNLANTGLFKILSNNFSSKHNVGIIF